DADLALLWLARSMELAPPEAVELQTAIRLSLGAWRHQVNSVRLVLPHEGGVTRVAFAPDGKLVTVGLNENVSTVRHWDPVTGKSSEPLALRGPADMDCLNWPTSFSPRCDYLILAFNNDTDGILELRDLATGKSVWEPKRTHGRHATSAAFSPDGNMLLIGYCVGAEETEAATGEAQLFEVATGKPRGQVLEHPRPVFAAAFHPDGKSFVTEYGLWAKGTEKVEARFWDLDGREIRPPLEHPCMAQAAAFSPDGTRLLTGHPDGKARLWNLAAFQEPLILQHEAPVMTVAFSQDGKTMLTGSADGTVRVRDLSGRLLHQPLRHGHQVHKAQFSPDGKSILVGIGAEGDQSRLWDLAAPAGAAAAESRDPAFFPLAFSPDRR